MSACIVFVEFCWKAGINFSSILTNRTEHVLLDMWHEIMAQYDKTQNDIKNQTQPTKKNTNNKKTTCNLTIYQSYVTLTRNFADNLNRVSWKHNDRHLWFLKILIIAPQGLLLLHRSLQKSWSCFFRVCFLNLFYHNRNVWLMCL